jgi:hypothetical protein
MNPGRYPRMLFLCALVLAGLHSTGRAQFFKVYEHATPDAGAVEFTYWTTWMAASDQDMTFFGQGLSREHMWAHSLEVEYGLSHALTVGIYGDFLHPADGDFEFIQTKLVARYQLFDKYVLPVDLALYGEYIIPHPDYQGSEKFETRIIMEKDIGPLRVVLNPILEKATSGEDVAEGLELAYAAGLFWDDAGTGVFDTGSFHIRAGVEFYGSLGELADFKDAGQQKHYIFPVLDLYAPHWRDWALHWSVGVGFGLGGVADDVVVKSILSLEFMS